MNFQADKARFFIIGVGAVIGLIVFLFPTEHSLVVFDNAYRSPIETAQPDRPPAMQGEADSQAALEEKQRTLPLAEQGVPLKDVKYRAFPVIGSRVAIWSVAQQPLLFADFVLAVPIFALIIGFIGFVTGDKR